MDTEEMVLCTHCNKEVAKANFDVHEPHCQRFLCLCPDCDETIPRDQLEDHKAEEHAEVKCQECNKKMERRHLMDHKTDECLERLQSCEYCELELPLSGLLKHSLSCGSRTTPCSDCGRYVQFQHQHLHALECSNGPLTVKNPRPEDDETVEKQISTCWSCLKTIPSKNLEAHKMYCKPFVRNTDADLHEDLEPRNMSSPDTPDVSFKFQKAKRYMERDLDEISTCNFCHLALPVKTLEWHEKKCELHKHLSLSQ
ncbi:XIAP-associated factor 1 [Triplophysa dalaica]|uniref:XIAP-associated factor 1 n=1 Tax=Triplophysa dalaica TaxID=1582913 RepID=UPI0024DFFA47|nr:XIAP-associated factor 1 [Triplophysa dalaica]XP_056612301.1 XIAP-associated factor 1 [Triplophysa dalaica]